MMPVHRHKGSFETCICGRGHFKEYFYDENGNLTDVKEKGTAEGSIDEHREMPVALVGVTGEWVGFFEAKEGESGCWGRMR